VKKVYFLFFTNRQTTIMNKHYNWLCGMKALSLIIVLFNMKNCAVSSEEHINDNANQFLQETNEDKRTWRSQPSVYNKKNNFGMIDYDELQKYAPLIRNTEYADLMQNIDYDSSKLDAFNQIFTEDVDNSEAEKRSWKPSYAWKRGPRDPNTNWANAQNAAWGKRQPGNWNNLRGLWGKRSTWGRLQGSWGRK
jgi:hypothetical protein